MAIVGSPVRTTLAKSRNRAMRSRGMFAKEAGLKLFKNHSSWAQCTKRWKTSVRSPGSSCKSVSTIFRGYLAAWKRHNPIAGNSGLFHSGAAIRTSMGAAAARRGNSNANCAPGFFRGAAVLCDQLPVKALYWALVKGTTESLPWRTRGEAANSGLDLISAKVTGFASAFPALILTAAFVGFERSTETTDAVPTALLRAPDS